MITVEYSYLDINYIFFIFNHERRNENEEIIHWSDETTLVSL